MSAEQDDVVVLRKFLTRLEAEVARGALEAANIHSSVSADDAGRPGTASTGVRLLVKRRDEIRAVELIGFGPPLA